MSSELAPKPARRIGSHASRGAWALVLCGLLASCGEKKAVSPTRSAHLAGTPGDQHYQLGHQYLTKGNRPDLAAEEFKKAVAQAPDRALYHYLLGLAYLGLKSYAEAEQAFNRTLELDPYQSDARNNLGIVYAATGRDTLALDQFERVLNDNKYSTPEVPRYNIARILVKQGHYERAIPYFRQALVANPDQVDWRLDLGIALELAGKCSEATGELNRVVERKPLSLAALYHLGSCHFTLRDYKEAKSFFTRVRELSPEGSFAEQSEEYLKKLESPAGVIGLNVP